MESSRRIGGTSRNVMICIFVVAVLCCGFALPAYPDAEDAPYYGAKNTIDLRGRSIHFTVNDRRGEFSKSSCSDTVPVEGTEFDGKDGLNFFTNYLFRMAKESSAQIDQSSDDAIQVNLEVLSPRIFGFVFRRVHGLTQFSVKSKDFVKTYCAHMKDGDPDSPLSMTSVSWTRNSAMRTMVSGSTSKTIEAFLYDLSKAMFESSITGEQEKSKSRQ